MPTLTLVRKPMSKYTQWCKVWLELVDHHGWFCFFNGEGVHVWAHPICTDTPKEEIIKTRRRNKDFFLTEKEVQKYVRKKYDWRGPDAKRRTMVTRSMAAKRRKKSKLKSSSNMRTA